MTMSPRSILLGGALLAALAVTAIPSVKAANGGAASAGGHNLLLTVDTSWVDTAAYRPVRIQIKPAGAHRAERRLTLRFESEFWAFSRRELIVEQDVVVPLHAQGVSVVVSLPEMYGAQNIELHVLEDGRELPQLTTQLVWTGMQVWTEGLPSILFVGDSIPDHAPLASLLPDPTAGWNTASTASSPTALPSVVYQPPDALPERWIDYSGIDVVSIPWDKLRDLVRNRPAAWQAICEWIRAGGNLWVAGLPAAERSELDKFLGTAGDEWRDPSEADRDQRLKDLAFGRNENDAVAVSPDGHVEVINEPQPAGAEASAAGGISSAAHFAWRECGLGSVTAFADPNLYPGTRDQWAWVLNTLSPERWLQYRRAGLSALRDNPDFWEFLIPGVGLAPVTAFRVVITLFVLLIGPINYFVLARRGQLQWLLATVPAAALVVTSAMFIYAMFSDGLTVRCRSRAYTWLDQRSGAEVTCARLSYYAGLAPAGGLQFSDRTAVQPLMTAPSSDDGARRRTLIWTGEGRQWLASGWLVSRRTTQFATTRSGDSERRLEIRPRANGSLHVVNELGSPLLALIVSDADGKLYQALDPQGREFVAERLGDDADTTPFIARMDRFPPELPPEMDYNSASQMQSRRYYWGWGNQSSPEPDFETSLLERRWMRLRSDVAEGKLRPWTYLAVLAGTGDLELGTDEARPEASAHIVEGVW